MRVLTLDRIVFASMLLWLLGAAVAPAAADSAVSTDASLVRRTHNGSVRGFTDSNDADVWLGIPFAQAPVGSLRWRAPRPPQSWTDVRSGKELGSPCSQPKSGFSSQDSATTTSQIGAEDCLYLNVLKPHRSTNRAPGDEHLPVMVWIHGGGYVVGQGTGEISRLAARRNIVIVSINYRLGLFGWFRHPALHGASDSAEDRSGNYALLDQIRALEWVRDNIAAFGGDPGNVTIAGQSAGGFSVLSLLASEKAAGLFHRAISQSGGVINSSIEEAENFIDAPRPGLPKSSGEVLLQLLIDDGKAADRSAAKRVLAKMRGERIAQYLHSKDFAAFQRAYAGINDSSSSRQMSKWYLSKLPWLVTDGTVLPKAGSPAGLAQARRQAVPVILGATRDEDRAFLVQDDNFARLAPGGELIMRDERRFMLADEYLSRLHRVNATHEPAAILAAQQPDSVFVYRFDWDLAKPPYPGLQRLPAGAPHAADLRATFGDPNLYTSFFGAPTPTFQEEFAPITEAMTSYLMQFVRTGAPGKGGGDTLPSWDAWLASGKVMRFDAQRNGGMQLEPERLTKSALLEQMAHDERLPASEERCEFLRSLMNYFYLGPLLTVRDYQAFDAGQCAARFPLGWHP
jgi:para-nitrobenzyl esterase